MSRTLQDAGYGKYAHPEDDNFYESINKKYKRYTIPRKRKTFNQICFPKEYKLQIPQQFLAQYMNPKTPYKGILIFHRIGAGKTCSAVNIAEQWKTKKKILVVTPASLTGNFRDELRSPCAGNTYLTAAERRKLSEYHPSSEEYKEIIKRSDDRINKYYRIYSYNKFVTEADEGYLNLRNTVLIIDEVQNMVSSDGRFYKVLYETISEAPANLRIILLSATPMFDKPVEIALTLNLLRIPFELPTGREFDKMFVKCRRDRTGKYVYRSKNLDIFKERITGYVSYFRGADPKAFPESTVRYVKCEMSDFQYKSYLTVMKKEKKAIKRRYKAFKSGGIQKLPMNFFIGTRIISNIAFPNKNIKEKGYESLQSRHMRYLAKYSVKFAKIISKINRCSGTVFVYSNFKAYGGIKSFIKVLEYHNYKNYSEYGEGRRRYAVWSGDEKSAYKDEMKAVVNQMSNMNGSKIKVMLLTPSAREGVSFYNMQQVHILEPYWNKSRLDQIIGRAIRFCSHKNMPEEKRMVKVYIYIATHPSEKETIDQHIQKIASRKNKLIKEFEVALKETAIDCTLFKHGNVYRAEGDKPIDCEL